MRRLRFLASCLLIGALLASAPAATAGERRGHGWRSWLKGDPADAQVTTSGGAMLAGGAYDRATAWRWFIDRAGHGDILIIRATGEDDYQPYVWKLGPVDSVQTLKLTKRDATTDPFVLRSVEEADGIFIAGGDQSDYVRIWKDSPVEDAINAAVARGVPIGGISAGLAVLGQYAFSAEQGTPRSRTRSSVIRSPTRSRCSETSSRCRIWAARSPTHISWLAIGWGAWSRSCRGS